jgi:hypothetical protein
MVLANPVLRGGTWHAREYSKQLALAAPGYSAPGSLLPLLQNNKHTQRETMRDFSRAYAVNIQARINAACRYAYRRVCKQEKNARIVIEAERNFN